MHSNDTVIAMETSKPAERSAIIFDVKDLGERPSRAVEAGRARRISRGIYTTNMTTPLKQAKATCSDPGMGNSGKTCPRCPDRRSFGWPHIVRR
ncbi:MAG TPA: hypothetical protein VMV52_00665 [Candidatus Nanopelagicaceae bacterium]|nr:hypothetical protein [Candidatus Nanopelagicaceae bacterium]